MDWGTGIGNRERRKILLAFGSACVAAATLFVAGDPVSSQYEITIYDSYPPLFWILLGIGILVGQILVVDTVRSRVRDQYWKHGFGLILVANAVLLLIPTIRYNLYASADMLNHIGYIKQIDSLGHVTDTNYYPNVHLFALAFSSITGIDVPKSITLLTPVMTVFYLPSVYVLLKHVFDDTRKVLFVLPFSSLLLFKTQHVVFMPSWFAFLLIPFAFYLLVRSFERFGSHRFKVLLIVTTVSLVFYHPAVTVFFIVMLVLFKGAVFASRRLSNRRLPTSSTPLVLALFSLVLFFSWYYSFRGIIGSTLSVLYVLVGLSEGSSTFGSLASVAARTDPQFLDIALVGIHNYGLSATILGFSFVLSAYIFYSNFRREKGYDEIEVFLGAVLLVFTVGGAAAFFVDVVLAFYRILRYAILAGSILIGIGFYTLFKRMETENVVRNLWPILYTSFFVLAFLTVFTLYGSPISADENHQITQAEIEGMEWFFEYRNTSLVVDQLGINQYRMHTFLRPGQELGRNIRWMGDIAPPPMHFAYENASNANLPPYTDKRSRRYLVVTQFGRERNLRFYPNYRDQWRHTPEDFRRLERNSSFSHVYDDGILDAYIVRDVGVEVNNSTATG